MDNIVSIFIYLLAVSTANEHAIRLIKPLLKRFGEPPTFVYYILSATLGIAVVWLCPPAALDKLITVRSPIVSTIVVGIATAGGSSMWHELLTIVTDFRTGVRQANAETKG